MTQFEITRPTDASSIGSDSIRPLRNSTFSRPVRWANTLALRQARRSISGVISTPIARPAAPTFSAARNTSRPAPLPRSTTTSPALTWANATGLPHERPSSASGTVIAAAAFLSPHGPGDGFFESQQQHDCFFATEA